MQYIERNVYTKEGLIKEGIKSLEDKYCNICYKEIEEKWYYKEDIYV